VTTGQTFYLLNFGYIALALAIGLFFHSALPKKHAERGRLISLFLIGGYLFFYTGIYKHQDVQMEAFIYYLLAGGFSGVFLHYLMTKLIGPLIFGRGWCGWGCWTAMVLDLLPWKKPSSGRIPHIGVIRYIHFGLIVGILLLAWYILKVPAGSSVYPVGFYAFAIGNAAYYAVGIVLAAKFKDNRAFCKYVCPIPTVQKIGGRFSILKLKIDAEKCIDCGLCEKNCPMNVKLLTYKEAGTRILSTECIMCSRCADICPVGAISWTGGFDVGFKEQLNYSKVIDEGTLPLTTSEK